MDVNGGLIFSNQRRNLATYYVPRSSWRVLLGGLNSSGNFNVHTNFADVGFMSLFMLLHMPISSGFGFSVI